MAFSSMSPPGEGDRAADAGRMDAEEGGDGLGGQAEMVAKAQDEDVAGDVGAEVSVGAGAADGVDARRPRLRWYLLSRGQSSNGTSSAAARAFTSPGWRPVRAGWFRASCLA